MKIYTKYGDSGKTNLIGKNNIYKSNKIVDCYGAVDELNSILGLLVVELDNKQIKKNILQVQNNLFIIGSYFADATKKIIKNTELKNLQISTKKLEILIDKMERQLPPLTNFILPGGTKQAATAHIARTTTRRVERKIVSINKTQKVSRYILQYINRLSDYFFVLARYLNKTSNKKDIIWKRD